MRAFSILAFVVVALPLEVSAQSRGLGLPSSRSNLFSPTMGSGAMPRLGAGSIGLSRPSYPATWGGGFAPRPTIPYQPQWQFNPPAPSYGPYRPYSYGFGYYYR